MRVHENWRLNEREFELSTTLIIILNMFKVDKSARQSMRMHESWWSNESESLDYRQSS